MVQLTPQMLGTRIRSARERQGLSQQALAEAVGLDRTMINRVETGQRKLTALELAAIADTLNTRMQAFFSAEIPSLASHRSAQGLDTADSAVDHLLAAVAADVEFLHRLRPFDAFTDREAWQRPETEDDAETMAMSARRELGYREGEPARDLQDRMATIGLLVFSQDFGADSADAGTMLLRRGGISIVNSASKVGRRRLSALHELGHYLIADDYTVDWRTARSGRDVEGTLDRFARAVLLPSQTLVQGWQEETRTGSVRDAAVKITGEFHVDMSTLARRLQELDLVNPSTANEVRSTQTTRADMIEHDLYPSDEMEGTTQPRMYQKHVLRLYKEELLSAERALGLLGGTLDHADLPPLPARQEHALWEYVS
ncbi:XRE family transcriptional regulator [Micrococcus sp.]|uniref:helix-turn-helix domain-containing protein n=1 Tax=Micrococcus sp. TaxID=1271 RepID=UPI002A913059|nr:XRE family transcriptional regulator [Micrococcus sp.]MDY6055030.1 XRE family transcriptional regulator [Micrococcus sp.]